MRQRQQSTTTYPIPFLLVDSADHILGKTGLSPTVTLSKNGAAFAAALGTVTEIGNGWYYLTGHATDRNTLGPLLLHASASGADPTDMDYEIITSNPFTATSGSGGDATAANQTTILANLAAVSGQLPTTLTTDGNMKSDIFAMTVFPTGAVVTNGSNTNTVFKTNLTESDTDYWKDAFLKIDSGTLINQVHRILGYNGSTKFITVDSGFTATPAGGVVFKLVNM